MTGDRYLAEGVEVSEHEAKRPGYAVQETIHLHDGVIRRAWYRQGKIVESRGFNAAGQAIRRLFHEQGRLARREYHGRNGNHISTERFGPDGRITESIQHGSTPRHWWYDGGVPLSCARGPQAYLKDGARWVTGRWPDERSGGPISRLVLLGKPSLILGVAITSLKYELADPGVRIEGQRRIP